MNLPDELKFFEKPLSYLKPDITADSITRIILWTLLFLGIAHFHAPKVTPQLPYAEEMAAQNLTPLSAATSDPRWSRNDLETLPENSIAWVAGSSIAVNPHEDGDYLFLPSQIKTNNPQYVSIKMARRMLDTYTMVKDTIARKPAGMVIVLNPFWDLQDTASFFKTNLMNKGAALWANPQDFHFLPLLSSPGNILWAAVGHRHNLIGNGYDYLKIAQSEFMAKPKKKIQKETSETLTYNQPTLFWMMNRYNEGKNFTDFDAKAWQAEVMAQNNVSQSKWGMKLLENMISAIEKSEIPTIIYIAPTSPALARSPAREAYQTIIGEINFMMQQEDASNIDYVQIPQSVINSMDYIDYLHVRSSGQLPAFLARQISAMMEGK